MLPRCVDPATEDYSSKLANSLNTAAADSINSKTPRLWTLDHSVPWMCSQHWTWHPWSAIFFSSDRKTSRSGLAEDFTPRPNISPFGDLGQGNSTSPPGWVPVLEKSIWGASTLPTLFRGEFQKMWQYFAARVYQHQGKEIYYASLNEIENSNSKVVRVPFPKSLRIFDGLIGLQ